MDLTREAFHIQFEAVERDWKQWIRTLPGGDWVVRADAPMDVQRRYSTLLALGRGKGWLA